MLQPTEEPLCSRYDLAMFDLDGVIYIGGEVVPGAADEVRLVRETGIGTAFITNNASRPPGVVAAHLTELGVPAEPADVVTSAQAAATMLRKQLGAGAGVVNLGAIGLREALLEAGLQPVTIEESADAVVSGFNPDLLWSTLMQAAVRIREGLPWVASNTDGSFPAAFGIAPGHGALVDMLRRFTGVEPLVAGKPSRPLLDETIRRVGGERPLMVGDRLDTDIEGAQAAGIDSLLVLTGVTGLQELVAAGPAHRPTYLARTLAGLRATHRPPVAEGDGWRVGGWRAGVDGGELRVDGAGDPDDWWRAVATAAWHHLDETGELADTTALDTGGGAADG